MVEKQQWDRAYWLWLAALVAGTSYFVAVLMRWDGPAIWTWKTLGVGLLAVWAAANARHRDGWVFVAVMAFGALGDFLLDGIGLLAGAAAFLIGHFIAISLYISNRRPDLAGSQKLLVLVTPPLSLLIAWGLTAGAEGGKIAMGYTVLVALMAAAAWTSRFPRYRTGIGAMLFLISDLFIFAGEGGTLSRTVTVWFVWPLYFAGQALIAWGVVSTLAKEAEA